MTLIPREAITFDEFKKRYNQKPMTPSQLEQLRDFLADKTLSFGCLLLTGNCYPKTHTKRIYKGEQIEERVQYEGHTNKWLCLSSTTSISIVKILGHPVTLFQTIKKMKEIKAGWNIIRLLVEEWRGEDDLVKQNPETQDFLWNIFKPLITKK